METEKIANRKTVAEAAELFNKHVKHVYADSVVVYIPTEDVDETPKLDGITTAEDFDPLSRAATFDVIAVGTGVTKEPHSVKVGDKVIIRESTLHNKVWGTLVLEECIYTVFREFDVLFNLK